MLAFRGAEGPGKNTTGGRGGIVVKVTNLNDSGAGSLRSALRDHGSTPRIIVFEISGTIYLQSRILLSSSHSNFTILGQTAPGDGITIAENYIGLDTCNNYIIRYMRFRLGAFASTGASRDSLDCKYGNDFIIDHCSISWGCDETGSFSFMNRGTIQWTIISEALNYTIYSTTSGRSYGSLGGGKDQAYYMCLLANNRARNPRGVMLNVLRTGYLPEVWFGGIHEIKNCVIFNPGQCISGYGGNNVNVVNNYIRQHLADESSSHYPTTAFVQSGQYDGQYATFYVSGNVHEKHPTVTADNLLGVAASPPTDVENITTDTSFASEITRLYTAEEALELVLQYAGDSFKRDSVDARVIQETDTKQIFRTVFQAGEILLGDQTGSGDGTNPEVSLNGIIDHQDDVGGYPTLAAGTPETNTSGDGIPDSWKTANGLDINTDYEGVSAPSGYDWIEEYSMDLVYAISEYYEIFSINGDLTIPEITSEAILTNGDPANNIVGDLTIPQITSEAEIEFDVPVYELNGDLTIPEITSESLLTFGEPNFLLSGDLEIPGITSDAVLETEAPVYGINGDLQIPAITSEATLTREVPVYEITGNLVIPEITSGALLTNGDPANNITGDIQIPTIVSEAVLEQVVPVFSITGHLLIPQITSGANLSTQEDLLWRVPYRGKMRKKNKLK